MNKTSRLFLITTSLAIGCATVLAETTPQARKAIEGSYAKLSKAFAAKDSKTFEAAFTDDFTAKSPGRPVMKRSEFFRDFEAQMNALKDVKWNQTIKSFEFKGKTAHVGIASQMLAKMPGRDGKMHDFKLTSKTANDWVKTAKGWKVHYSETSDLKMWMDGKPMNLG